MPTIDTSNVTNPFAAFGESTTAPLTSSNASQDRFLTLLVTQLKNQDPLNPLDNAQVTSQLAQISTVDGIQKVERAVQSLSGRLDGLQTIQAAGLVGRQVLIEGNELDLYKGVGRAGIELTQPVDQLAVTISDATGRELQRIELGAQREGLVQFAWDGLTDAGDRAADGHYGFALSASAAGQPVDVKGLVVARVDGVASAADGFLLSLGGYGNVNLTQVKQII